jgi:hypothetical protein
LVGSSRTGDFLLAQLYHLSALYLHSHVALDMLLAIG